MPRSRDPKPPASTKPAYKPPPPPTDASAPPVTLTSAQKAEKLINCVLAVGPHPNSDTMIALRQTVTNLVEELDA